MTDQSRIDKGMWWDRALTLTKGCTHAGKGCAHCWAESATAMRAQQKNPPECYRGVTDGGKWNGIVEPLPGMLERPLHVKKPTTWAVWNDLFHESIPDEFIDRVFAVMASGRGQTFVVLTKRSQRTRDYFTRVAEGARGAASTYEARMREHFKKYKMTLREGYSLPEPPTPELRFIYDSATRQENGLVSPNGTTICAGFSGGEYHWRPWPLSNVILGYSASTQDELDAGIEDLLATPGRHVLSLEPLLEPIVLDCDWILRRCSGCNCHEPCPHGCDMALKDTPLIDWVIAGAESGQHRRECKTEWLETIAEQCEAASVPCFIKQGHVGGRVVKLPTINGRRWSQMPTTV